jgi:4-phosphopantoate--beta-alanine ligase
VPAITDHARDLADASDADLQGIVEDFDANAALDAAEERIRSGDDN